MGKIAANPDLPVGAQKELPSTLDVTLYMQPGANRTAMADAPVDIWLFELSGDDELMAADFLSLSEKPRETLAISYIRHRSKQLLPGRSAILPMVKLKEDTSFLGVAVGFAEIDKSEWRAVEKVKSVGEDYKILIPVKRNQVEIQIHR